MSRNGVRAVIVCLSVWPAARAADAPARDEAAVRELLKAPLGFRPFVFAGERFPGCRYDDPAAVERLIGPYTVTAAVHDRAGRPVVTAAGPGPYFAVVTVAPKTGRPLTRLFTLFRVPGDVPPDARLDPARGAEFAAATGLDPAAVTRQRSLIADVFKGRPFAELAADLRAARLLAGLAVAPADPRPVTKLNDAFAYEREAWVTVRRRVTGLDREFPGPFVCPTPRAGPPAPVVRPGTPAEAGVKPDAAARIDAALTAWAADDDQPFAVCVVRRGVIVLHKAYGTRAGTPLTVDTPSWMASVTKAMSATLMMTLVDRGLVGLDDPVDKYVPALRGVRAEKPLTVRHLYTHTNGLDRWPGWDDQLADVEYRVADVLPLVKVGAEWKYNGLGYTLGGKVIEDVTGEAVPLAFKRHLLDPLGCTGTEVVGTHADAYSIPLDMAKFGQLLLNRGAYGDREFVRPVTFEAMLPRRLTAVLGPGTTKTFGIGLDGRPEKFGHGAASAATFSVDVRRQLVVIMTRNKIGKNYDKYNGKFWDAIETGLAGE